MPSLINRLLIFLCFFNLVQFNVKSQKQSIPIYNWDRSQISETFDLLNFANKQSGILKDSIFYGGKFEPAFIVNEDLYLRKCIFDSAAFLNMGSYNKRVDFHSSVFKNGVTFGYSKFNDTVSFKNVSFGPLSSRLHSDFNNVEPFLFYQTFFARAAIFVGAKFNDEVNFNNAEFGTILNFQLAEFNSYVKTFNIRLPDTIDFTSVAKIKYPIDLSHARPKRVNEKCMINLYMADVSKILINYEHFKLYFPDSIRIYNEKPTMFANDQKAQLYQQLLKQFQDRGLNESYKLLDIEYKEFQYLSNGEWFANWLQKKWWNYGYDKELILYNTIWILIIFIIVNYLLSLFFGYEYLHTNIYEIPNLLESIKEKDDKLKSRIIFQWYLLIYVIVYTSITFFTINLNLKFIKFKSIFGMLFIVIKFVVGLICLSYLANLVLNH